MSDARALFSLDGLVCLVTGAGSGIGRATAAVMKEQGAIVAVNDIDRAVAEETCRQLGLPFEPAFVADVTDPESAASLMAKVKGRHGCIDILVNNAAAPVPLTRFLDVAPELWATHLSSLLATLACTRAALPDMIARGFGRIVNISSISGTVGVKDMVLYGAAKGGIHAFTAGLAKEIAATGVTINCVAPGTVDTPRQRARPAAERAERMARAPIGRFADPREVGAAVAFLASRESAYITGEILYVDGGRP
jgi:NAD(P)-dependent dehydrogenase (short-subunit alcohol dehydrogenase family)